MCGTLLVVVAEFVLLTAVYERGRPARSGHAQSLDLQAKIIYAVLLLVASVGWMLWFRRLVTRHRVLQDQLTSEQSRVASEQRLGALVRNSSDVVLVCDLDLVVGFVTPSVRSVLGFTSEEMESQSLLALVDPADADHLRRMIASLRDGADESLSLRMQHADGRLLNVEGVATNLIGDDAIEGVVVTLRDVTDRVRMEEQLTRQAFHDSLTGLANRQLFQDRLSHALQRREPTKRPLVVMFCDLDEFKNINDSLGHGVGDQVLVQIAARVLAELRPADTVARLGGDEFAILLEDTDLPAAELAAQRIMAAISRPLTVEDHELMVRASLGLAQAHPGSHSAEDLLRNADVAMYLAKDRGKGTIAIYLPQLHAEALRRLELRADLQRGIRREELVLHFQPTVKLDNGHVAGFEALVRWNHPTRGLLPPGEFIGVAEQSGLIHALGSWVLREACIAAMRLFDQLPADGHPFTMSVNVASQQLAREDFVTEVLDILAETGHPAQQLTLEITESALLLDLQTVIGRLAALREHGVRIAVDDFGTGYSSLSYLRDLPIDALKVDKAFVDRLTTDSKDAALASAILTMSASLNLMTIAEGVEDPAQARWLTAAECGYAQGFLWSRPIPFEQASELLRKTSGQPIAATPRPSLPPPRPADSTELGAAGTVVH